MNKKFKNKILYNAMITPDGTVVENNDVSVTQHHDDKNGNEYWVAGLYSTIRQSSDHGDEQFITMTIEDEHDVLRDNVTWGTRGKSGTEPVRQVKIKDMEEDHLEACLRTQHGMAKEHRTIMENELKLRWLYTSGIMGVAKEKKND